MSNKFTLSPEVMEAHTKRHRAYHLDMADQALNELVDEFISIGNSPMASLWSNMRMHLYQCGKALGIEEKDRAAKFETVRDKSIEQQKQAIELLTKG